MTLNLSKSDVSLLPGRRSSGRKEKRVLLSPAVPTVRAEDRLALGFFKRLITPDYE